MAACRLLAEAGAADYFNVVAGSMAGPSGSVHVVPPMALEPGYVADPAARLKALVDTPVLVAGRINQPQIAEQILGISYTTVKRRWVAAKAFLAREMGDGQHGIV